MVTGIPGCGRLFDHVQSLVRFLKDTGRLPRGGFPKDQRSLFDDKARTEGAHPPKPPSRPRRGMKQELVLTHSLLPRRSQVIVVLWLWLQESAHDRHRYSRSASCACSRLSRFPVLRACNSFCHMPSAERSAKP